MVLGSDFGGLSARGLMLAGGAALVYSCYIVLGQRVLKQLPVMVASLMVTLAFFMPMIAGMTGNTGTQSLAVVVRGLVSRDIDKNIALRLVMRELGVGLIIGTTCGILITIIAYVWLGNPILGLVVGSSLLITLVIGTLAGTVIPLIVYKMKIDPAVASGPLITTLNDVFSLMVYFGVATFFIAYLV